MKGLVRCFILICLLVLVGCATVNPRVSKGYVCKEELKNHVIGTLWQWNGGRGEKVFFNEDGYVDHAGWSRRGLVTRWKVIDRRTILFEVETGRSFDSYAVLCFSEDMSSYHGYDFHKGTRMVKSLCLEK